MVLLCPDLELAFAHVPRTGGTSIARALAPYAAAPPPAGQDFDPHALHEGGRAGVHVTGEQLAALVPAAFVLVATVREPASRLLSMFAHHHREPPDVETFRAWAVELLTGARVGRFYSSQVDLLTAAGVLLPDVLLRYERLEEDWRALARSLLPEPVELERLNSSEFKPDALELAQVYAAELWPEDVAAFGGAGRPSAPEFPVETRPPALAAAPGGGSSLATSNAGPQRAKTDQVQAPF